MAERGGQSRLGHLIGCGISEVKLRKLFAIWQLSEQFDVTDKNRPRTAVTSVTAARKTAAVTSRDSTSNVVDRRMSQDDSSSPASGPTCFASLTLLIHDKITRGPRYGLTTSVSRPSVVRPS